MNAMQTPVEIAMQPRQGHSMGQAVPGPQAAAEARRPSPDWAWLKQMAA